MKNTLLAFLFAIILIGCASKQEQNNSKIDTDNFKNRAENIIIFPLDKIEIPLTIDTWENKISPLETPFLIKIENNITLGGTFIYKEIDKNSARGKIIMVIEDEKKTHIGQWPIKDCDTKNEKIEGKILLFQDENGLIFKRLLIEKSCLFISIPELK